MAVFRHCGAVTGCAIREKYSGSDFPRAILPGDIRGLYLERYSGRHFLCDIQGGVAGWYPVALFGRSIPDGIFRVIFRAVLRAVSGCAIRGEVFRERFSKAIPLSG